MQDSAGAPVTGLAFGDVVVKYSKEGDNSLTTKTIIASPVEWFEIGQGLYEILFRTGELNTIGFFKYFVTSGSALQYPGLAEISADLIDDVKADTVAIQAKTDGLNFAGANVAAVVANKGVLNNPPSEDIDDYKADVSNNATEANATANKEEIIIEVEKANEDRQTQEA